MSQQSDEYAFLTGRLRDLLAEEYGFREHWDVAISSNIARGGVLFVVALRQNPIQRRYGDVDVRFDMATWLFAESSVVRGRVIEAANTIVSSLRYRGRRENHPPQVKIYCWLQERNQETQDQYMVPESRPNQEPPFSNSVHLHVLLQDLLRCACEDPIRVYPTEVRIGERGSPQEIIFRSPRELSHAIAQIRAQRQAESIPTVTSQPRSHVRRVEL